MNEREHRLSLPPPSLSPATGIWSPSTGPGLVLTASGPTAPLEAAVVFTHGLPREPGRAGPGRPAGPRRSAELCCADSHAGGRGGPCPATPPLLRSSPTRRGQGRPSSRGRPGGPGPIGGGQAQKGEEAAAARSARPAIETRSLRCSSLTGAGDADRQLPLGDSVSLLAKRGRRYRLPRELARGQQLRSPPSSRTRPRSLLPGGTRTWSLT